MVTGYSCRHKTQTKSDHAVTFWAALVQSRYCRARKCKTRSWLNVNFMKKKCALHDLRGERFAVAGASIRFSGKKNEFVTRTKTPLKFFSLRCRRCNRRWASWTRNRVCPSCRKCSQSFSAVPAVKYEQTRKPTRWTNKWRSVRETSWINAAYSDVNISGYCCTASIWCSY